MNPRLRKLRSMYHEKVKPAATNTTEPIRPVTISCTGSGFPASNSSTASVS